MTFRAFSIILFASRCIAQDTVVLSPSSVSLNAPVQQQFTVTVTRGGVVQPDNAVTFAQFQNISNPVRHQATPFLVNVQVSGLSSFAQLDEPIWMEDPLNAGNCLAFFSAIDPAGGASTTLSKIYRATCSDSSPTALSGVTSVITGGSSGCSSAGFIQLDSIIQNPDGVAGHWYLYSSCQAGAGNTRNVGLYTSTDNGVTWAFFGIVVANGTCATETSSSQLGVIKLAANSYASLRARWISGSQALQGIRYASSTDGKTWSLTCSDTISIAAGPCSNLIEGWGPPYFFSSTYVYLANCYDGTNWTVQMFTTSSLSSSPVSWTGPTAFFTPTGTSTFDQKGVATLSLANLGSLWYAFYQGANWPGGSYALAPWALGSADLGAALCTTNAGSVTNHCLFNAGTNTTATVTATTPNSPVLTGTATVTQTAPQSQMSGASLASGQIIVHP